MSGFCTGCGKAFAADDRFCAACGKPRAAASDETAVTPATETEMAAAAAASRAGGGAKAGPIVLAIVFLALGPILFFATAGGSCTGSTEGNVVVSGGPRPGFTFTPTDCHSMQPFGRFGANLHGDGPNDGAVYVSRDPITGTAVQVEIPGSCRNADGTECTLIPLPRDRCRTFEGDVDFNGTVVNDVRLVEGHVAVDCTLEDGTTVRGRITFDGC